MAITTATRSRGTGGMDLSQLPAASTTKGRGGIILCLLGLVFGSGPLGLFAFLIVTGRFQPAIFLLLLFDAAGTCVFLAGLYQWTLRQTIVINSQDVSFDKKSIFGRKTWTEPLASFEGILYAPEQRSTGGENSSTYTVYVLRLYHADKKKRILLWESVTEPGMRQRWEEACRVLGVPAVEMDGKQLLKRDVEDLDKSVTELYAEKKLQVDFDPLSPPPRKLEVYEEPDATVAVVHAKAATVIGTLFGLILGGGFAYVGFHVPDVPRVFGYVGAAVCALTVVGAAYAFMVCPALRISGDYAETFRKTLWGSEIFNKRMESVEIETVRVGDDGGQGIKQLIIVGDLRKLTIGRGLNLKALEWFKGMVLSKLVKK